MTPLPEVRQVVLRSQGTAQGSITRLISPDGIGKIIKPFVLLDDLDIPCDADWVVGMHAHSGIAKLTLILTGSIWINDTVGTTAVVTAGDLDWLCAASGAWHESARRDRQPLRGLQLTLALPPHLENTLPQSQHIRACAVPRNGPEKVLMGAYRGATGPVPYAEDVTCLHVEMAARSTWIFVPPPLHTVAWIYVYQGRLAASGEALERELVVFEHGTTPITFTAENAAGFILGSASAHEHTLEVSPSSVHTSRQALDQGMDEIRRIGRTLPSHCFKWLSAQSGRRP